MYFDKKNQTTELKLLLPTNVRQKLKKLKLWLNTQKSEPVSLPGKFWMNLATDTVFCS